MTDIAGLSKQLSYTFNTPSLLVTALTHRSANKNHYERMEFLGDAVLNLVISDQIFVSFPEASEGQLSRLRASLVKGENLSIHAKALKLGDYLQLGSGELKSGGYRRNSILADVFESIIGAIYLDGGFEPARKFILDMFAEQLASTDITKNLKDPKTQLQELLQSQGHELPQYKIEQISGQAHNQTFEVSCQVAMIDELTIGKGTSRRKAEQAAAKQILQKLKD